MKSEFIAALCIFLCIPPYFVWHTPIIPIAGFLAGVIAIKYIRKPYIGNLGGAILLLFLYLYYSIKGGFNIFGWLGIIAIIPFFFSSEKFLRGVYSAFYKIFIYTMIISFVVYILVVLFDVSLPYSRIEPLNLLKTERYYSYPFLVYLEDSAMRFCALYDEPGVVGTIAGMILLIERFDFRKWQNIALLIMAVMSFSMYFVVICVGYIFLYGRLQYKVLVSSLLVVAVILLWDNEILYELIFRRFTLNADGQFVGNTRDNDYFSSWYEYFRKTPAYFTGLGPGMGAEMNEGGCSYKQVIVDYGVIYFILYVLSFYILSKKHLRLIGDFALYSLLFISTLYQRPFIGNIAYVFFFIVGASVVRNKSLELKESRNESINDRATSKRNWRELYDRCG